MVSRDWGAAQDKVAREGRCRVCGEEHGLEAAHIISRRHDPSAIVNPSAIVPLCRRCHAKYDHGRDGLELLPYLTLAEQAYAVGLVGIERALRRTTRRT